MSYYTPRVKIIGAATGLGCSHEGAECGPFYLKEKIRTVEETLMNVHFGETIRAPKIVDTVSGIKYFSENLSQLVFDSIGDIEMDTQTWVIGGDHSCAIGTWSGVQSAYVNRGLQKPGLIWFDCHMDSHTPYTSRTKNFHGMPLAILLGYGEEDLTRIGIGRPMLDPEKVCLIGIQNYGPEEKDLLDKLGIKYYTATETNQRGLEKVLDEAIEIANPLTRDWKTNPGFGISIDLDVIDASEMTSVNTPCAGEGLSKKDLIRALRGMRYEDGFIGLEIAEFNPTVGNAHEDSEFIRDLLISIGMPK